MEVYKGLKMKKIAFTLAEVMIVLVVVGVLSAILIPIAFESTPNKNIMKFKKDNAVLYKVINSLITSNKYYCNGYLGQRGDCNTWTTYSEGRNYICETIADALSVKSSNCTKAVVSAKDSSRYLSNEESAGPNHQVTVTNDTIAGTKRFFDTACKSKAKSMGKEIEMIDGTVLYQAGHESWGTDHANVARGTRPDQFPANNRDQDGFDAYYKIFCMDIDGFDETAGSTKCDDINDICPFGYGIRADGLILNGERADKWLLEKKITDN